MANGHGSFCWCELMTGDPAAAVDFYRGVVGWKEQAAGSADTPYTVLMAAERGVGGVLEMPAPVREAGGRPHWIGYILVDDVDRAAARLVEDGGTVHRAASDIPAVGRFAVVADPQGAAFCLFKNAPIATTPPELAGDQPGAVGWRELMAADGAAAFAFYAGQFGWTRAGEHDMGAMGTYQLFATGGEAVGGMMTKPAEVPAASWNYYFRVDAVGAAVERLKAGGGSVINGPHQVPGGNWIVQAVDPQGAMFALVGGQP